MRTWTNTAVLCTLALLRLSGVGVGSTTEQAAPPPTLAQAQARLQGGDLDGARTVLEQIVAARPKDAVAWRMLATARRQSNEIPEAIAALQKALAIAPDDAQTLFDLGITHAAARDAAAAFEWLGKARASRRIDLTQLETLPAMAPLRTDARYPALLPTRADFADPFVEPVTIIREWTGEAANDQFGWIARSLGDVDGDGVDDVATSAPTSSTAAPRAGRIYVYSSKRGALLWTADGSEGDQLGSGIEAAGDVNGDGASDVIASAPFGGYAKVFDGRTGAVLLTLKSAQPIEAFGMHVDGAGDVNGDKVPDLIVGAPGAPKVAATFDGHAYIYSGKDGTLIHSLNAERPGDRFGAAVAGLKSDSGPAMLAVGAPAAGPARTGRTYVYRGLAREPAFVIESDDTGSALGAMFLSFPGDLDGDGVADVYASDWANTAKGPSTGRIFVHSGRSGRRLLTLTGETAGEGFGTSPSAAGDVDGDGVGDLIVGAWQHGSAAVGAGRAYLYSGRTGRLIRTFTCKTPGDAFGFDAVGIGDVNGDGAADLLITSAWSGISGFRSGRVFIVSSK
jgi:hypothetical protein